LTDFLSLPVYKSKDRILSALERSQVIVVESPTGSGKTTQIPLILKEAGYDGLGVIGITQPRRIAALSVSEFIKRQFGISDNYCAYTMRFSDTSDETTRIKIMTDGILLQELKGDPLLSKYSVIMVDEAHERSLNIDFILGLLKQIVSVRTDLKVIVSSATINTKSFSDFFGGAEIISIDAKVYPINIIYSPLKITEQHETIEDARIKKIVSIVEDNVRNKKGDVLAFLPGEFEIKGAEAAIRKSKCYQQIQLYPLYGRLSKEEQERVFTPTKEGMTKVVVATNIAETSITIDGITTVIDSGVAKVNFYNQKDFTSSLLSLPISKSSARQRAGRSGRTQEGTCYRLYSKDDLKARPEFTMEEILRSDLTEVALRMSDLKIYDYERFPFITRPKKSALESAEETLKFIDAIDDNRRLTPTGEKMVLFPLLPRHSRVIVEAIMNYPEVIREVLIAVSFLSTKSPYLMPSGKEELARTRQSVFQDEAYGDFYGYLKLFKRYADIQEKGPKEEEKFCKTYFMDLQTMNEIMHIDEQLEEIVSSMGIPVTGGGSIGAYLSCLAAGLLQYVCYRYQRNCYRSLTANQIYIHPGSSWFETLPEFILAGEIVQTSRMFARSVSPLKKEDLDRVDPTLAKKLMNLRNDGGKKEREKEPQRAKGGDVITLAGKKYIPSGKKKDTITLPLSELRAVIIEARKKGSVKRGVKILLENSGRVTESALPLKTYAQEGSLVPQKQKVKSFSARGAVNVRKDIGKLKEDLKEVFTLQAVGKYLMFVGMQGSGEDGVYRMRTFRGLSECIDSTYGALNSMRNLIPKNETNAKAEVGRLISMIKDVEDF